MTTLKKKENGYLTGEKISQVSYIKGNTSSKEKKKTKKSNQKNIKTRKKNFLSYSM